MKKEIIASIRIRFDARFLSGARPFLRRGPGEQVFFFFEFFQRTMRMLALDPGTPTGCPAQRCRRAPGWKAPFARTCTSGFNKTERRFPRHGPQSLFAEKVTSGLLSFKIRDAVVAWGKSCLRSCLSFFFKTPSISCIVA